MSRFLAAALVLALAACNGTSFSDFGILVLRTETHGVDLDPDGYSIRLDGQAPRAIGLTDSLVLEEVASGEHSVDLNGLAENCSTTGENPLPIITQAAMRTEVTIQVTCVASAGARVRGIPSRSGKRRRDTPWPSAVSRVQRFL